MARKILAGVALAAVSLLVGLSLNAAVTYVGHENIGNYAEARTDTCNATAADSIWFDCEHIYEWSISASVADIYYMFKIAGTDSVAGPGYLEATSGVPHTWKIAPSWIKVQASAGSAARWNVCVQGYEAGDASGGGWAIAAVDPFD